MSSFRKFTLDRADFGPPPPIDLGDHAHAPVRGRTRVKQEEDATAQTPALTPAPRRISITQATPVAFEETGSEETAPHDNEAVCEQAPAAGATPQESRFSLRKRFAALFALLAVPAMAAPGDFGALAGDAPTEGSADAAGFSPDDAMPFERPGMSFPGSAFYYLADPPAEALLALPSSDPLDTGAEAGREIGQAIDAGPAARPIYSAGAGTSHTRALQCLSQAIWYEAASESEAGQRAVAQVVLNRVAHPSWPASVCGVVYEGSQRSTGCQFSFTCDGSLARRASGRSWQRAQQIAASALSGDVYAPIGHATHYHTLWVNPYWAKTLDHVGTIGAHRFYRNRGKAGEKTAFTNRYKGEEPWVSGRTEPATTVATSPFTTVTPTAQSQQSTPSATAASAAPAGAPYQPPVIENLADPALKKAGQARDEYANAGKWKTDPSKLDLDMTETPPAGAAGAQEASPEQE